MNREESGISTDAPIFRLSDKILGHIMTFLTLSERLLAERTCQWFRNVSIQYFSSVEEIAIEGWGEGFDDHTLNLLLRRGTQSLKYLTLSSPLFTDDSLHGIAQNCENLQMLSLCGGNFTDDGLKAVAKRLPYLQTFRINIRDRNHDEGYPSLVRGLGLELQNCALGLGFQQLSLDNKLWWIFHECKKLRSVYITEGINGKCLEALGPDVTILHFRSCSELEDAGIQKMLHSCCKVESLSILYGPWLTDVSLSAIGQCSTITELHIGGFPHVTKLGLLNLCRLKHLKYLTVSNIPSVDDDVFVAISKSCHQLSDVDELEIWNGRLLHSLLAGQPADLDIKNLGCSQTKQLNCYDSNSKVTDIGISSIAAHCPLLSFLNASRMENISDLSLKSIATHSAHIEEVHVNACPGVTDEGVVDLINRCPKLSFLCLDGCRNIGDDSVTAAINRAKRDPSDFSLILTVYFVVMNNVGL